MCVTLSARFLYVLRPAKACHGRSIYCSISLCVLWWHLFYFLWFLHLLSLLLLINWLNNEKNSFCLAGFEPTPSAIRAWCFPKCAIEQTSWSFFVLVTCLCLKQIFAITFKKSLYIVLINLCGISLKAHEIDYISLKQLYQT